MKKIITIFSVIVLITSLTACSPDFNGSRTGNDKQLIMEYTAFNTTDSQDLVVEAGDIIHTEIVIEDGQLSYKIQKNDDEPIAESEGIFFSVDYDVEVEESGTYTVTVTGEKTKGILDRCRQLGKDGREYHSGCRNTGNPCGFHLGHDAGSQPDECPSSGSVCSISGCRRSGGFDFGVWRCSNSGGIRDSDCTGGGAGTG